MTIKADIVMFRHHSFLVNTKKKRYAKTNISEQIKCMSPLPACFMTIIVFWFSYETQDNRKKLIKGFPVQDHRVNCEVFIFRNGRAPPPSPPRRPRREP